MLLVIFQVFVTDILTLHLTVFLFFFLMSWHKNYICIKKIQLQKQLQKYIYICNIYLSIYIHFFFLQV